MKIRTLIISLFVVAAFCFAAVSCGEDKGADTGQNGNGGGDNNGDRGKDVHMEGTDIGSLRLADPFVMFFNKMYYAYGTSDTSPNAGFDVYYSSDMNRWKKYGTKMLSPGDSYGNSGFWAPEVYYRESEKLFYLFYTVEEHICVATCVSPLGPFKQSEKVAMRSDKAIDSSLFIDDDGTPYLYYVRFTGGNVIWGCKLNDDWKTFNGSDTQCIAASSSSSSWERVSGRVVEGPSVFKEAGVYYMIYSANSYTSKDYAVGYATASSPLGPWTKADADNPILIRAGGKYGTGHGARFQARDYSWKYVYHAHPNADAATPRDMYITDMTLTGGKITMSTTNTVAAREVQ